MTLDPETLRWAAHNLADLSCDGEVFEVRTITEFLRDAADTVEELGG